MDTVMEKVNDGVMVIVILCVSFTDGIMFYGVDIPSGSYRPVCVHDEFTARELGVVRPNDRMVQFFETRAYRANRNAEVDDILYHLRGGVPQGLHFVTVDGTVYPCDCTRGTAVGAMGFSATFTLSYGFEVDVQAKSGMIDSGRHYMWLWDAKVTRCE